MICQKCKEDKPTNLFSKNQKSCKSCKKEYYLENREEIRKKQKLIFSENKEDYLIRMKEYYLRIKDTDGFKEKQQKRSIEDRIKNPNRQKEYYYKNKEKIKENVKKWTKNKYRTDREYRLKTKLNLQIVKYLNEHQNLKKISKVLGYDIKEFINEIGSPKKGYDIDHKIPLSWFKEGTPISVMWDLRNLHIITSKENRVKSNKWCHPIVEEYRVEIKDSIKDKYIDKFPLNS
jgi:hypothetical protein|tara:strand:+ start:86 stop:781 length:696 start_codon:yes stop_codon:yes gene_type:complete